MRLCCLLNRCKSGLSLVPSTCGALMREVLGLIATQRIAYGSNAGKGGRSCLE